MKEICRSALCIVSAALTLFDQLPPFPFGEGDGRFEAAGR